jgi:type I restriction enzyme S subunit
MSSEISHTVCFKELLAEPVRNGVYKQKEFHGRGCKIVNMGELFGHPRMFDIPMKRVELTDKEISKSLIQVGDLLFARRSLVASGAGKCSVVKEIKEATTFESSLIRARPDVKKVSSDYLYYYFSSQIGRENMAQILRQMAVSGITGSDLMELKITCPSLDKQIEIAKIMNALDDRIALLRETNTTLEAIAQALFKSWFVNFDPVRAEQEGREPEGMDADTAALFPDSFEESELGLVPKGWKVDRLENWLSVLETGRRPKGGVAGILEGVPSIGAESIVCIGQYDYSKIKYVSKEFFDKMKSGILQSNDVLLYKDGGKPGVFLPRVSMFGDGFPFETCGINEHVFRVRLKQPFNQPFLYFWLWSDAVMHELKHRGGKAAIPGINQSDVKEQKISVPDVGVLQRFDELVSPLVSRILNNAKKSQTLATLRDTMLPRLISGQLRLPDAEALIGKAIS